VCQTEIQDFQGFRGGQVGRKCRSVKKGRAKMVVVGVSRTGSGSMPVRQRSTALGFGLKAQEMEEQGAPVPVGGVAITSLLAMQESESGLQQDREARSYGEAMVDELADLQLALLGETGPDLDRLEAVMRRKVSAADPGLAGVLRAIRLRAGVELARRGRATSE
jgi:hypothetical protein